METHPSEYFLQESFSNNQLDCMVNSCSKCYCFMGMCQKLDVTKWQQLIVGNKRDSKLQHVCTTYLTELIDSNMFVIEMCKAWCMIPSFLKCIKNAVKGCFHLSWTSGGKPFSAKCSAFLCFKRQSLISTPKEDTNRNTLGKHKWVCCA